MNTTMRRALLMLLAALALSACSRMRDLKLPANPPLSRGLGWALVKDSYVRLKENPSEASRDLDHLRRGAVFALEAREIEPAGKDARDRRAKDQSDDSPRIWYGITSEGSKGWVRQEELDVYSSKDQAERAARAYR